MCNTKIGEFCTLHNDWETLLITDPYNIKIKRKDGFVIFNYNQISSDFNNEIVRECRGIIFKEGEWESPVCHAFDKFGNFGESYVPELDWHTVKVSEKIDGSIMKLWSYNGAWRLSTNSNIDAEEALVSDIRKETFAQIFWETVGVRLSLCKDRTTNISNWLNMLDARYTYIFELVSPYTRVVIPYEYSNIYFLGARNNISNFQFGCDIESAKILHMDIFSLPKLYQLQTLDQVITAANSLPWDNEGYVCYDKYFNRCKIKSPKYVMAHFARNNNVITRKHLIDFIITGEMEEFLIYASDYKDQIMLTKQLMDDFTNLVDAAGLLASSLRKLNRADAAIIIKHFPKIVQSIMFLNLDTPISGKEYVKDWDANKWERMLEYFVKMREQEGMK